MSRSRTGEEEKEESYKQSYSALEDLSCAHREQWSSEKRRIHHRILSATTHHVASKLTLTLTQYGHKMCCLWRSSQLFLNCG